MVHFLCNKKEAGEKKPENIFVQWMSTQQKSTLQNIND